MHLRTAGTATLPAAAVQPGVDTTSRAVNPNVQLQCIRRVRKPALELMLPLGKPVVPDVYAIIAARSSVVTSVGAVLGTSRPVRRSPSAYGPMGLDHLIGAETGVSAASISAMPRSAVTRRAMSMNGSAESSTEAPESSST